MAKEPLPSVTIRRRLEWMDTDAAQRWHWTTFFRFVEAAEAALHDQLGITHKTFGLTPRVHVDADFRAPLLFNELVDVTLAVTAVGRTSVTYDVSVERDGEIVAEGRLVAVLTDGVDGPATSWPDELRALLAGRPSNSSP